MLTPASPVATVARLSSARSPGPGPVQVQTRIVPVPLSMTLRPTTPPPGVRSRSVTPTRVVTTRKLEPRPVPSPAARAAEDRPEDNSYDTEASRRTNTGNPRFATPSKDIAAHGREIAARSEKLKQEVLQVEKEQEAQLVADYREQRSKVDAQCDQWQKWSKNNIEQYKLEQMKRADRMRQQRSEELWDRGERAKYQIDMIRAFADQFTGEGSTDPAEAMVKKRGLTERTDSLQGHVHEWGRVTDTHISEVKRWEMEAIEEQATRLLEQASGTIQQFQREQTMMLDRLLSQRLEDLRHRAHRAIRNIEHMAELDLEMVEVSRQEMEQAKRMVDELDLVATVRRSSQMTGTPPRSAGSVAAGSPTVTKVSPKLLDFRSENNGTGE